MSELKINSEVIPSATDESIGGIKTGYTTNDEEREYKVQTDTDGNAYVNVPWIDTKYSGGVGITLNPIDKKFHLKQASTEEFGGIKTGYTENGQNYKVQTDTNGKAFVNVPWKKTTPSDYLQNIPSTLQSTHAIHYTKIGNNQFDGLIKPASPCSIYEFEYSSLVNGLVVNLKESTRQTDNIYDVSGLQTMPFTQNIKIYMSVDAYRSLIVDGGGSLYFEPDDGYVSDIKYFYNIYRLSDRVIPTQRQSGLYTGDLSKISHTILDITCYYDNGQDSWQILVEQNVFLLSAS